MKNTDWKRAIVLLYLVLLILSGLLTSCAAIKSRAESIDPTSLPTEGTDTDQLVEQSRQLYQSEDGQFSLQYPATANFYKNQQKSVDGVLSPAGNTIAIQDTSIDGSVLNLTYFTLLNDTALADFIRLENDCLELSSMTGQTISLQGHEALLFPNTNCGPYGATYIYTIAGNMGYRFTIESQENYLAAALFVDPILDSFKTDAAEPLQQNNP